MKTHALTAAIAIALVCSAANPAVAGDEAKYKATLESVPAPEMPAKAAALITAALPQEREDTVVSVVLAAVDARPAAVASVVGTIARAVPEVALLASATAVARQPKQAGAIVKAAVVAAPAQAGKIVFAVCKQSPSQFNIVAMAAAQAAPAAGKEILEAVAAAIPNLKAFIQGAPKDSSLAEIIAQTEQMIIAQARQSKISPDQFLNGITPASLEPPTALPPPSVSAPFTPITGSPSEVNRNSTGEVSPGGGRDYSGP